MFRFSGTRGSRASIVRRLLLSSVFAIGSGLLASACLDRPVAEISPYTTNLFIREVPYERVDKIDIVFMIDNSASMADKQKMLAQAVPELMKRLVTPLCTNGEHREEPQLDGNCAPGLAPEFKPVRDIHIAVVSSSLGGFGSGACDPNTGDPTKDDRAHLVGTLREGVTTYQGLGFLAWDPGQQKTPPGTGNIEDLQDQLRDLVEATGETGCGYEASLESWYRFLIQPDPPQRLVVNGAFLVPEGLDTELIEQRRQFLRPDSLVAIVMLSDENDCSIAIGGQGQLVGASGRMPRGTDACTSIGPNDPCCRPCTAEETTPRAGCTPLAQDPVCSVSAKYDELSDQQNVRCFDQKRRFGVDLLFPIQRYIEGLTQEMVPDRNGNYVANPLYVNADNPTAPRPQRLVFLAGIVGVPWQDIATDKSLTDPELEYLTATEIAEADRWSLLLGDEGPPQDPFMIESIAPRDTTLVHPITQSPIVLTGGTPNPINGQDYVSPSNRDLQYACIYPLTTPVDCTTSGQSCDCKEEDGNTIEKPLCRDPDTGVYGTTQYFAKAYPGSRQLQVLEGLEDQAIVASICPKVFDASLSGTPSYGYNPAVQALIDRIGAELGGTCLPRELDVDPVLAEVPCRVIEAVPPQNAPQGCAVAGREEIDAALRRSVERKVRAAGRCDVAPYPACSELVMCGVRPAQDEGPESLASCQNDGTANANGFCYIDAARNIGNPELVADCGETEQRMLRLVTSDPDNNPMPRKGATVFTACRGKTLSGSSSTANDGT